MGALPLAIYRAFSSGMPVLLGLYIAHQWGLARLGAFSVAAAALAVATVIADWGSSRFLPRELSRKDAAAAAVTATSTGVRLVLAAVVVGAGLLFVGGGRSDREVLAFLALFAPVVFASVISTNAVSVRVVDADLSGILLAVATGVVPVVVTIAIAGKASSGALFIVAAYSCGKWIETLLLARGRWAAQKISFHHAYPVFLMMLPFGLSAIMGTVYSRLPVFVLERWSTRAELGIVSIGSALQNVLLLVPTAAALMVYPRLTVAVARHDRADFRALLVRYVLTSSAIFGMGLSCFWLLRSQICRLLGAPVESASFLFLYAAVAFISTINVIAGAVLQAAGAERRAAIWGAVILTGAIPLQVYVAQRWGMWGVLGGIALSEVAAVTLFSIDAWRTLRRIGTHAPGLRATTTT